MRLFLPPRLLLRAGSILASLTMVLVGMSYLHIPTAEAAGGRTNILVGSTSAWVRSPSVQLVGHHASNASMIIGVWLSTRDLVGQQALIKSLYHANSAAYHQWLSAAAFNARFAPAPSDVSAVQNYLTNAGLRVIPSPDTTLILAQGTTSQIERAFQTNISDFSTPKGTYFGATRDLTLPASIRHAVLAVVGLSNLPVSQPHDMIDNGVKPV